MNTNVAVAATNGRANRMGIYLSKMQSELLKLIPSSGSISTVKLVEKFYNKRTMPRHAQSSVTGTIRTLVKLTNNEPITRRGKKFRVRASEQAGPYPMKVWLEAF